MEADQLIFCSCIFLSTKWVLHYLIQQMKEMLNLAIQSLRCQINMRSYISLKQLEFLPVMLVNSWHHGLQSFLSLISSTIQVGFRIESCCPDDLLKNMTFFLPYVWNQNSQAIYFFPCVLFIGINVFGHSTRYLYKLGI